MMEGTPVIDHMFPRVTLPLSSMNRMRDRIDTNPDYQRPPVWLLSQKLGTRICKNWVVLLSNKKIIIENQWKKVTIILNYCQFEEKRSNFKRFVVLILTCNQQVGGSYPSGGSISPYTRKKVQFFQKKHHMSSWIGGIFQHCFEKYTLWQFR